MNQWRRRDFLSSIGWGIAATAWSARLARGQPTPRAPRPTMLLHIFLGGGIDAVLTTNPKRRGEVAPEIDVPYQEDGILTVGGTSVGPLFHRLAPHVSKMAILNGVVCSTVAHPTGNIQTREMRRVYPPTGLGLSGTLGALLAPEGPLHDVRFTGGGVNSPRVKDLSFGRTLVIPVRPTDDPTHGVLFQLSALARNEQTRADALAGLESALRACGSGPPCMPFEAAHDLLLRMPREELPEVPNVSQRERPVASNWRDALFLLRHKLTPAVFMSIPLRWDTHTYNAQLQARAFDAFLPTFVAFLDDLQRTRTVDGELLADQVGIVISSELGRFPIVNEFQGKDHFPEFPAVLIGPGVRPGQYGQTDAHMISTPISPQTGHPNASPRDIIPTIDDLGATILHWFGVDDPPALGYFGRRLDFLLA